MKTATTVANWNDLENIDDIPDLSKADENCLEEIKAVLARHGKGQRFGVCLLHKHFELNDDEVMFETINLGERTLSSRPMKTSALTGVDYRVTAWRFDPGGTARPIGACASGLYGAHYGYKDPD